MGFFPRRMPRLICLLRDRLVPQVARLSQAVTWSHPFTPGFQVFRTRRPHSTS
jgi:hypothetical protein